MRRHRLISKLPIVFLVTSALGLTGCSMPIDFWQQNTLPVDAAQGMPMSMNMAQEVNVAQQPEAADLSAVTQLQIPEIVIQVTNPMSTNAAQTVSGTLTLADPSDSSWTPIVLPFSNLPVEDSGTAYLNLDASDQSRLSTLMLTKKLYTQSVELTVDSMPAQFTLTTHVHVVAYVELQKVL